MGPFQPPFGTNMLPEVVLTADSGKKPFGETFGGGLLTNLASSFGSTLANNASSNNQTPVINIQPLQSDSGASASQLQPIVIPPLPPTVPKINNLPIIITGVVLVGAIGFGAYYFSKNKKSKSRKKKSLNGVGETENKHQNNDTINI